MRRLFVTMLVAVGSFATPAIGDDEAECQSAYVAGQKLYKLEHDLVHGREQLLVCAKTCPDQLRESCGRWLKDIERELPSIVVKPKDARDRDVPDVTVAVDDVSVANYVEGLPIELNPGKHWVRVSDARNHHAAVEAVVVTAGEKLKVVEIRLEPRAVDVVHFRRPTPRGTFVLLGVGALALASFGTFAIWSSVEFSNAKACAPVCNPSTRDTSFDAKAVIADFSLATAGVVLLAAAIVYFTRPTITERVQNAARVGPMSFTWFF